MVEPFAAVIFNTILSGRSTLRYPTTLSSVARVVSSSSRSGVGSDFFIPQPRRVKGKGKAEASLNTPCQLAQCQEWSSCLQRHLTWSPHHCRFVIMEEIAPNQNRCPRRFKSRQPQSYRHILEPTLASSAYGGQRRHASNASKRRNTSLESIPHPATRATPHTSFEAAVDLEAMISLSPSSFDLDKGWAVYEAASSIPLTLHMKFMELVIRAAELHYDRPKGLETLHMWGSRTQAILTELETVINPASSIEEYRLRLLARSVALAGDIPKAIDMLHRSKRITLRGSSFLQQSSFIMRSRQHAYEAIMLSIHRHQGSLAALEFIAAEWNSLGSSLTQQTGEDNRENSRQLLQTAFKIAVEIDDPVHHLGRSDWDKERREDMGNFFIEALCYHRFALDALEVFHELGRQRLRIHTSTKLLLVRSLTAKRSFGHANAVFISISNVQPEKYYLSTGLHLSSHRRDINGVDKYYEQLKSHGWVSTNDIAMRLYLYARLEDHKRVHTIFDESFPAGPNGKRLNSPLIAHYTPVIYVHSQRGDSDGVKFWLEDMSKSGLIPDVYIYTLALQNFTHNNDLDAALSLLQNMREAKVPPNVASYTVVITLLAHRKDAPTAEAIFRRALDEGIVPDRRMLSSLMDAHVESGSWEGVIRIFDYIHASPARNIRVTIEVYNILLKAYVLIGAPFHVVARFFQRLERSKTKPDQYTFCLLIQSACDAGKMVLAADLYYEMERLAVEDKERDIGITVYVLTILMAGFLRLDNRVKAKAVYDEMLDRGIHPTAVALGTILKAYGNEKSQDSLQIAEAFIKHLTEAPREQQLWNAPSHGFKSALQQLYAPVISAYAKQALPEESERLLDDMSRHDGRSPPLGLLAIMLDAYRRSLDIENVILTWRKILEVGVQSTPVLPDTYNREPISIQPRKNILSVPFSIFIDATSAAGRHLELGVAWQEMKELGFSFDSHNWNHLVVALVRAGVPDRAFQVVEKVLLPNYQHTVDMSLDRDMSPTTPLSSELQLSQDAPSPPMEPPMHGASHRASAVSVATEMMPYKEVEAEDETEREREFDFALPLYTLHQASPLWGTWRPHKVSLGFLLMALNRLRSGEMVQPVLQEGEIPPSYVDERQTARRMLDKIHENYPNAVSAVLEHEIAERRRLGDEYDTTYNWK